MRITRTFMCGLLSVACVLTLAACGGGGGGGGGNTGTATATIGFTGNSGVADAAPSSGFASRDDVPTDDVESLVLTITKIVLHRSNGGSDDDDSEEEGEEEPETVVAREEGDDDIPDADTNGNRVIVFDDPVGIDVDVKQLDQVSEILSTAIIPAGKYTKIVIYYENPRLYLAADPETEITDIQVTANGRMFISQNFTIEEGEATLIILDFGGIQLTYNPGADRYVLTPQLRVVISLEPAEVEFEGVITTITPETMMIAVDNGQSVRDVVVTEETSITRELPETSIVLNAADGGVTASLSAGVNAARSATEAITFDDLMVGDVVEVEGEAQVDGTIIADEIEVQHEDEV